VPLKRVWLAARDTVTLDRIADSTLVATRTTTGPIHRSAFTGVFPERHHDWNAVSAQESVLP
jgi:hypothetical protein